MTNKKLRKNFGIKAILIAVGLIAIGCNWCEVRRRQLDSQIKCIKALGGRFRLDDCCSEDGVPLVPTQENPLNADFPFFAFRAIKYIDLSNTSIKDSDLSILSDFKYLVRLDIQDTEISNAGLMEIGKLRSLKFVKLSLGKISLEATREISRKNLSLSIEAIPENEFLELMKKLGQTGGEQVD